jgi:hypothetical protein
MRSILSVVASIFFLQILGCEDTDLQQGKPLIEVEPAEIHFRTLNRLETEVEIITVRNTGTASLRIEGIGYEGDPEFTPRMWDGVDLAEVEFPDGIPQPFSGLDSFKELSVTFNPEMEGDFAGEVIITSNASNQEEVRIPIDGLCSVPDIDVIPTLLDFGSTGLNSTAALNLTIKNRRDDDSYDGLANLIIAQSDIVLAVENDEPAFNFGAQDIEIVAGEQQNLEIRYAPKTVEVGPPPDFRVVPHENTLLIHSNDPDENPVEIPLIGRVSSNLPPLVAVRVQETTMIDGTPIADPCAMATSDTIKFEATVVDPEGNNIPDANFDWQVKVKPVGSQRQIVVPNDDAEHPTYRPDMYGDYTICLSVTDPQGNSSTYDETAACSCEEANAKPVGNFDCQCVHFTAYPREDIRIELIWNNLGPDLDLHLLAPGANVVNDFCVPSQECRFDPASGDPWARTACVEGASMQVCRVPNCDPVVAGCQPEQECYNDGNGDACWWKRCSGRDCYWGGRNPDWGGLGDETDDPSLDIDCTDGCRAENINLNHPEQGLYQIMVNYYEPNKSWTDATVRIFFKGDILPTAEFTTRMWNPCDTWNVATINWTDPEDHPVTWLDDSHVNICCQ